MKKYSKPSEQPLSCLERAGGVLQPSPSLSKGASEKGPL